MADVLHIELDLNAGLCTSLVVVMAAPAIGLKTIAGLLDTNSTHMGIAYAHLIAPHTCDYIGYVRHLGYAARSSKNHW